VAELGMNPSMVDYVKLEVCGLKARTKKPAPKYTEEQATRAKRNCRKIYRSRMLSVKFDYVGKRENAQNFLQARPTEMFWGIMKKRYSAPGKPVKNLNGFKPIYRHLA
jgi:hypothetical protein